MAGLGYHSWKGILFMVKCLRVLKISLLLALIPAVFTFSLASDLITVKRVIDGDTLLLGNGERVRLIGVDTPEVHESDKLLKDAERTQTDVETIRKLGQESSAFVKKTVQGQLVRLEYDQANVAIGHRDRYGRTLAYLYLEDGTFLNAMIVRQGYGVAYTKYPFKYADEFRKYEREYREKRRGLWGN
jgi:micrococcal nuclease